MQYRTREGQISAADTVTSLGGLYGVASATAVQVPANSSKIVGLMVSVATDGAANAASTFAVQLQGDGLTSGTETLTCGSITVDGTNASNGNFTLPFQQAIDIPVIASNQVSIAGIMAGDSGTVEMSVTLVFA